MFRFRLGRSSLCLSCLIPPPACCPPPFYMLTLCSRRSLLVANQVHRLTVSPPCVRVQRLTSRNVVKPPGMDSLTFSKTFGVGFAAGGLGSLIGLGGGFIIIPGLVTFLGATQHQAHGTSLAAIVATAGSASLTYWSAGAVDIAAASAVTITAVTTASLGARLATRLNERKLKFCLGVFMMAVAPLVPLKSHFLEGAGDNNTGGGSSIQLTGGGGGVTADKKVTEGTEGSARKVEPVTEPPVIKATLGEKTNETQDGSTQYHIIQWLSSVVEFQKYGVTERDLCVFIEKATSPVLLGTGLVSGFCSGLFGVGGGTILVPALAVSTALPQQAILGTSLAAMILPSCVGALSHHRAGNVMFLALPPLLLGSTAGAWLGGTVALELPEEALRWLFAAVMGVNGAKFAWAARPGGVAAAAAGVGAAAVAGGGGVAATAAAAARSCAGGGGRGGGVVKQAAAAGRVAPKKM